MNRQNSHQCRNVAGAALVTLSVFCGSSAFADGGIYDIQVANRRGYAEATTTGGAIVAYIGDSNQTFGPSGSGTFDPFVRIQASPSEAGYNTDGQIEFDTKTGTFTHSMLISEIPVVTVGGTEFWEIFADINEGNNAKRISLDIIEIYFTDNPAITGYPFGLTPVYAFDGAFLVNDVNQGSGRGDVRYLIPTSSVPANCNYRNPACEVYFVLYSELGGYTGEAGFVSEGGFEEWKVKIYEVSSTTSAQDWLPNDTATVSWTTGTTLSGTVSFTLYEGSDCGATGGSVLRDTETVTLTDATSPASVSTSNTTVLVTESSSVSWKVIFSPDGAGVLGSSHCESTDLDIQN